MTHQEITLHNFFVEIINAMAEHGVGLTYTKPRVILVLTDTFAAILPRTISQPGVRFLSKPEEARDAIAWCGIKTEDGLVWAVVNSGAEYQALLARFGLAVYNDAAERAEMDALPAPLG